MASTCHPKLMIVQAFQCYQTGLVKRLEAARTQQGGGGTRRDAELPTNFPTSEPTEKPSVKPTHIPSEQRVVLSLKESVKGGILRASSYGNTAISPMGSQTTSERVAIV